MEWTITSWEDVAILAGILTALAGVSGGMVTTLYNNRKSKIDKQGADSAASDRIIRLVEVEAEKQVEVVRTEFKLQIAEMELRHHAEITSIKHEFEKQIKSMKKEHDIYRCELAPVCSWRNKKTPPPPAPVAD